MPDFPELVVTPATLQHLRDVLPREVRVTARTHPLCSRVLLARSFRRLRGELMLAVVKRDDPPPYRALNPDSQPVIGTTSMFGQEMPLTRFTGLPPTRAATGDLEQMSLLAGESTGLVHDIRPAADILARIAEEAATVISSRLEQRSQPGSP